MTIWLLGLEVVDAVTKSRRFSGMKCDKCGKELIGIHVLVVEDVCLGPAYFLCSWDCLVHYAERKKLEQEKTKR